MTDDFDHPIWDYRAVFKQTDGGGGTISVTITATSRMTVMFGMIGPNDYAAGRAVYARLYARGGSKIATLMNQTGVDNTEIAFPWDDHSTWGALDGPKLNLRFTMGKGDYMLISALTLAQNEELTIAIRALMPTMSPPDIITTGSGGTVTTTETYNRVV